MKTDWSTTLPPSNRVPGGTGSLTGDHNSLTLAVAEVRAYVPNTAADLSALTQIAADARYALLSALTGLLTQSGGDARYVLLTAALTQALADARYVQVSAAFTQALADARYVQASSPSLTGVPTAPTAALGTASTQLATCAFVMTQNAASSLIVTTTQAASYTFTAADASTVVESTGSSAATFTVPANASVPLPVGTVIESYQAGTGTLTIAAASGVTINSAGSLASRAQYATLNLRKRTTDGWVLSGDTA